MKMSRISQFCYPLHWHKSGVGGFLPEIQGTYDPYVSWMCMMTEPISPPTDFSCLGLRSSHNLSANKKNLPIIWNADITHATGPEPMSALLQNGQLFLLKNDQILLTEHIWHHLSSSTVWPLGSGNICSNKAAEQTHRSDHLGTGCELIAHMSPCLPGSVWTNLAWQKVLGSSRAWRTRRERMLWGAELSYSVVKWNGSAKAKEQKLLGNDTRLNFSCCKQKGQQRMLTLKKSETSTQVSKTCCKASCYRAFFSVINLCWINYLTVKLSHSARGRFLAEMTTSIIFECKIR